MARMLSQWPRNITRFSASGRRFPVNDSRPGGGGHIAVFFGAAGAYRPDILYT
jgi:hypothetical protein